jgi:hypothetical protein
MRIPMVCQLLLQPSHFIVRPAKQVLGVAYGYLLQVMPSLGP